MAEDGKLAWAQFLMDNLWKIGLAIVLVLVLVGVLDLHLVKAGGNMIVEWVKELR